MKKPIISFHDQTDASAAIDALGLQDINASHGSEMDKEKTIYTVHIEEADEPASLAAIDDELLAKAIHCPACDGVAVEFPARARASSLFNAIERVGDAIAPPAKQPFFCRVCSNQWF